MTDPSYFTGWNEKTGRLIIRRHILQFACEWDSICAQWRSLMVLTPDALLHGVLGNRGWTWLPLKTIHARTRRLFKSGLSSPLERPPRQDPSAPSARRCSLLRDDYCISSSRSKRLDACGHARRTGARDAPSRTVCLHGLKPQQQESVPAVSVT